MIEPPKFVKGDDGVRRISTEWKEWKAATTADSSTATSTTTASPPAIAHGLLKSLELISDNSYRTFLNHNIQYWKKTLRLKKWVLMPSDTAIQPIMIGRTEDALQVAQQLYKKNIWVPAIRPPTVPANTARLRITFSASHNKEQIDQLVQALVEIEDGL